MKHRLFLAIDIPPATVEPIVALQNRLGRVNLPITWETPEKIHLPTNFIGKMDDIKKAKVARHTEEVMAAHSSFSLTPAFLETMYCKHEGSYVYLGVAGDMQALKTLQWDLTEAISAMEIAQPDRYLPQITIGRLKKMDPLMTKDVLQQLRNMDFDPLPPFTVTSVSLFESLVSREGSHLRRIRRFMLN